MRKLLAAAVGLTALATMTPSYAELVTPPFVGVVNTDELVTELTQLALTPPDPGGDNAGQYRCDLNGSIHARPDANGPGHYTVVYTAQTACTDQMRGIDMNAYLASSFDGGATWDEDPDPSRATCVECTATTPISNSDTQVVTTSEAYFRVRIDFKFGFKDGHAWRFSPLCGEPEGTIVYCRRYYTTRVPAGFHAAA